jgi:Flp pilus assembly protein TadB
MKAVGRGVIVQTFTVDPRRWWIGRLFARNPLLRRSDRIEVLAILAALVALLVAIAVAGAVGAEIHDVERRADAKLAQTRHPVSAAVIESGAVTLFDGSEMPVVRARWVAGDGTHTDSFPWSKKAMPGDSIQIWVDNRGNHVNSPAPLRPALDAFTVAVSIVLLVVSLLALALALMRWRFRRARDAQWDREIRSLAKSP